MAQQAGSEPEGLRKLGKYVIKKKLGSGGMGTVFLAHDTQLNRTVALKVLPRDRANNPVLVKRFKAEGQAAAYLEHENIVRVYEAGEADGFLYIALEYVDGIDVHALVEKREVLAVNRSIDIIRQTALALQHAHEKNIVHRDIKPSNLMIRRNGSVKLADMGLARSIDDTLETNITRAGTTVGTVDYMSPEQARNSKATDARSDIYSLGCTWYHMLTGQPPFPEGSMTNKLQSHATGPIPDPRHLNPSVPEAVVAVLNRMMAKKPADRYQTAGELLEDLDRAKRNQGEFNADVLAALAEDFDARPVEKSPARKRGASEIPPRELPARGDFDPNAVPQGGLNLDALRYAIPAALVVGVLALIFWAARQGGEALSGTGGVVNPYVEDEDPVVDGGTDGQAASGKGPSKRPRPRSGESTSGPLGGNPAARQVLATFPGAEDVPQDTASVSGLRLIPDWVQAFRTPLKSQLAPRVVRPHPKSADEYRSLTEALQKLPAAGAHITLADGGPFLLEPTVVRNCARLVITAADHVHPLIVIPGKLAGPSGTGLSLVGGRLELRGVHFMLLEPVGDEFTMIRVESGELAIRDSSVTYGDQAGKTATAIALASGKGAEVSHALLENVVVRGRGLTSIALEGPRTELVVGNALLASQGVPTVVISDSSGVSTGASQGNAPRVVRLLATSILSDVAAVEFARTGESRVPCDVVVRKCALLSTAMDNQPEPNVMVQLRGFSSSPASTQPPDGSAIRVTWETDQSLFAGWSSLVDGDAFTADSHEPVRDATAWRQFWEQPLGSDTVADARVGGALLGSPAAIVAADVVTEVQLLGRAGADGKLPGLRPDGMPAIPEGVIDQLVAARRRPTLPTEFGATLAVSSSVKRFNLSKDGRLGRFLSGEECPSGIHVVAFGSGLQQLDPIVIADKTIRLEFEQDGDTPLVLQPRVSPGNEVPSALITVSNGTLDLVSAPLRLPASGKPQYPQWLISLEDGSLSVRHCTLEGPGTSTPHHAGLIRWDESASISAAKPGYIQIADSYLSSVGNILSGPMRSRAVVMTNSILASQSETIHVLLDAGLPADGAALIVNHCTLAAGGAVFRVEASADAGASTALLELFVRESVFAGPVAAVEGLSAAVCALSPGMIDEGRLIWWGYDNGYAPSLERLLSEGSSVITRITGDGSWTDRWGDGHEVAPLSGPTGVLFESPFGDFAKLKAEALRLAAASEASHWDETGRTIGADWSTVGAQATSQRSDQQRGPTQRSDPRALGF